MISNFEAETRKRLKHYNPDDIIFLKKDYKYEIFDRHRIMLFEIEYLLDSKRIIIIYPNEAFEDRIDAEINAGKNRKIKIIFRLYKDKIGIITAFTI